MQRVIYQKNILSVPIFYNYHPYLVKNKDNFRTNSDQLLRLLRHEGYVPLGYVSIEPSLAYPPIFSKHQMYERAL